MASFQGKDYFGHALIEIVKLSLGVVPQNRFPVYTKVLGRLQLNLQSSMHSCVRSSHMICLMQVFNPEGEKRVLVTKELPGSRWLDILTKSGCRVDISQNEDTILSNATIKKLLGSECHGVLGQLTEVVSSI